MRFINLQEYFPAKKSWKNKSLLRSQRSHLRQPLLTFGVSGGDQRLFGLMDQQRRALHHVASRVQHGCSGLGVSGGGSNSSGRLRKGLEGLGRLPGSDSCSTRAGAWPFDSHLFKQLLKQSLSHARCTDFPTKDATEKLQASKHGQLSF